MQSGFITCLVTMACLWAAGCTEESAGEAPGESFCQLPIGQVEQKVDELLQSMTLQEKVEQMHGLQGDPIEDLFHTADNPRLGIPGYRMVDGPRGVRAGNATAFPVGAARGATWDPDLEERVGKAMGLEATAKGANVLLAPCINILRHPRWGRAQETYGEDSHHLGRMGAGFVRGVQKHLLACAKHFAANSLENNRFWVDVQMDERTLREVYLPHFKKVVQEAQVASVMSAYNQLNGSYCAENRQLLTEILKDDWGFLGFVVSDWVLGTRSTEASAVAGLDIEMPVAMYYGEPLTRAVQEGRLDERAVDEAVRRILRTKYCYQLDHARPPVDPGVVESQAHTDLAREVAQRSLVLLKNENAALPLDVNQVASLAVVGRLADQANLGDRGSSYVSPSYAVTPLQGIQEKADFEVIHLPGDPLSADDRAVIGEADAVVLVAGYTSDDEGESRDRESLLLLEADQSLIEEVAALNDRVIVVLESGSVVVVEDWIDQVDALLVAWYPGQEGGHAIADVLFGEVNPSGRLPVSFPDSPDDLPQFENDQDATVYDSYHGYRLLDRSGQPARFPFGFGLSYTTFEYVELSLSDDDIGSEDTLRARIQVRNSGTVAGIETVQLYISYPGPGGDRAVKDLKAFGQLGLPPGESGELRLEVPVADLAFFRTDTGAWEVEPGDYQVLAGPSSGNLPLSAGFSVH